MTPFSTSEPTPSPCDLCQLILLPETLSKQAIPLDFLSALQESGAQNETNDDQARNADTPPAYQFPLFQEFDVPVPGGKHAYALLCAKSREIGLPRLWHTDLTRHDAARLLAADAPQRFCWSVRETGTWLYSGMWSDLRHLLCWELHGMWGSRFFAYDAGILTERSFHDAIAFVQQLEAACNHGKVDEGDETLHPLDRLLQEAAQRYN